MKADVSLVFGKIVSMSLLPLLVVSGKAQKLTLLGRKSTDWSTETAIASLSCARTATRIRDAVRNRESFELHLGDRLGRTQGHPGLVVTLGTFVGAADIESLELRAISFSLHHLVKHYQAGVCKLAT
jgi:hypothetical protein